MAKTARETALFILERCRRSNAFSDALLGSAVKTSELSPKDAALCTRLCYGVLQNAALCDFYIDHYSQGKASKIEPKVRDILRLSVYQILFLTKIPPHAAVSEGVELCKKSGFGRASGFVNAVLRKISAEREHLPQIPKTDFYEYLSIKYSTPKELVRVLCQDLGNDFTENFLAASNSEALTSLQVNTLKITTDELLARLSENGISVKQHDYLPNCLELEGTGDIATLSEFNDGLFYVQDAAARMAVLAAAPKPGDKVLDACAAPGGKSFAAAIMMQNKGSITSCDLHDNKLSLIESGAARLGIDCIKTHVFDASHADKAFYESFDLVIADVPCSGLGVIRKKPDIRYKSAEDIMSLPKTQLAILSSVSNCVKPGGVLIYSTCTVLPRENEDIIRAFLEKDSRFSLESFTLPQPIGKVEGGMLSLYPQTHGTDGFFIAKLRALESHRRNHES